MGSTREQLTDLLERVEAVAAKTWDAVHWNPYLPPFAHDHTWADQWPSDYDWMRDLFRDQARASIAAIDALYAERIAAP